MGQIKALLPDENKGLDNKSDFKSASFSDRILSLLGTVSPSTDLEYFHTENIFHKLRKNLTARSRLENLHNARAFKYGSSQFGPKSLYKDSQFVARKLKSQSDRRKFRHGLKGDVDFLNQLNITNISDCFVAGDAASVKLLNMKEVILPSELFELLKKSPL